MREPAAIAQQRDARGRRVCPPRRSRNEKRGEQSRETWAKSRRALIPGFPRAGPRR